MQFVEDLLPAYYRSLRSGKSFTQAKKNVLEQSPVFFLPEALKDTFSAALYKKYESEILNVIFNKPFFTIEVPDVSNFSFDTSGRYFYSSAAIDEGTRISVWNTSNIAKGEMVMALTKVVMEDYNLLMSGFNLDSTKLYAAFDKKAIALDLSSGNIHTFAQLPEPEENGEENGNGDTFYNNFNFIFLDDKELYAYIVYHDVNHHTFRLVSIETDQILKEIDYTDELQPEFMRFYEKPKKIFIAQNNGSIRLIDPTTLIEQTLPAQANPISFSNFTKDKFFAGDVQGNIIIWDLSTQGPIIEAPTATIEGLGGAASGAVSYSALSGKDNGNKCAVTFENSSDIVLYNIQTQQKFTLKGHSDTIDTFQFTPDDNYLISTSQDGTIQIWDVSERALIDALSQANPVVHAITKITGHSPDLGILEFFRRNDPDVPFYIFTCVAAGGAFGAHSIRIWFMPKQDFFGFDQTIYLLSLAKLLDSQFLKTFQTRREYDDYIDGLMDVRILQTFSLPLRQNFMKFLEEQKAKKIAPAISARSAEAP